MASDVDHNKAEQNQVAKTNESNHFSDVSQAIGWVEKNGVQRGLGLWRNLKLHQTPNRTLLHATTAEMNDSVKESVQSTSTSTVSKQVSDKEKDARFENKPNTKSLAKTDEDTAKHEHCFKRKASKSPIKDFIKLVDDSSTKEKKGNSTPGTSTNKSSSEPSASPSSLIEVSSEESQEDSSACSVCSGICHCSNSCDSSESSDFVLEEQLEVRNQQSLDLNIGQFNRRAVSPLRINSKPNQSHSNGNHDRQHNLFPWLKSDRRYSPGVVGLHEEINDFYEYIRPSQHEIELRNYVIEKLEKVVKDIWPMATVTVFGSFRTGLFLPNSDLDVAIKGRWRRQPLFTLEQKLIQTRLASPDDVKVISHATVPIVKYIDAETNIRVDISFNTSGGVETYELINSFKQQYPSLEKLVMILKLFLLQRKMNEVFTGGLSSYCLTMLVVNFFQMHRRVEASLPTANLGVLLIEFFELYGIQFNYSMLGIRIRNNGSYVLKSVLRQQMQSFSNSILCLEDPVCPTNELARGSYSVPNAQFAFESAFVVLNQECGFSMVSRLHHQSRDSILGLVIHIPQEMIEFRRQLQRFHSRKLSSANPSHSTSSLHLPTNSTNSSSKRFERSAKSKSREPIFDLELISLPSTASNASPSSVQLLSSDSDQDMNDNKVQLMRNPSSSRRRPYRTRSGR